MNLVHCKKHNFDQYIGRPKAGEPWRFGNPFVIGVDGTRDEVCNKFEQYVEANPLIKATFIKTLAGKDLVCFCKPERCHGDYLLRIANPDVTVTKKLFTTLIF